MTAWNEYDALRRVALRDPAAAFRSRSAIEREWRTLNYKAAPDFAAALAEFDAFARLIEDAGAELLFLSNADDLTLDSIYVRDAGLVSPQGAIAGRMGKPARAAEPAALIAALESHGLPVAGRIDGQGLLEGGDFLWFDEGWCAVGEGYRSNPAGIEQLRALLPSEVDLTVVALPHYKGPSDVFHLMSIISPLDRDLALVYSPLMPVRLRMLLLERGLTLVEAAPEEFESKGCNVLALAPRLCLIAEGNPETCRRLEAAGCEVLVYRGREITHKGDGGPTCLTRPLERAAN
jgi:N-dimethylarginine dimethylaminohydrolase